MSEYGAAPGLRPGSIQVMSKYGAARPKYPGDVLGRISSIQVMFAPR